MLLSNFVTGVSKARASPQPRLRILTSFRGEEKHVNAFGRAVATELSVDTPPPTNAYPPSVHG